MMNLPVNTDLLPDNAQWMEAHANNIPDQTSFPHFAGGFSWLAEAEEELWPGWWVSMGEQQEGATLRNLKTQLKPNGLLWLRPTSLSPHLSSTSYQR